jgi:single-stranded-DNA-specific exonuclease
MEKRWDLKERADSEAIDSLASALKINRKLCSLLIQRGIHSYDEAERFFRPKLTHLHDPFLMKDMDRAVDRILLAEERHEKVTVYGDYDVDGTSAVALVFSFLKNLNLKKTEFYLPDRYDEGYGISYKGIDKAVHDGYTLMIALDCGIKAVKKVEYARSKGLDIIICDHHRPADVLPDAAAVLDPKQDDCPYPFKDLSSCGVGFKLTQALAMKKGIDESKVYEGIDLVAVSIAADIVPIVGENRVLAYYGLQKINTNPRVGIDSLLVSSGLKRTEHFNQKQKEKVLTTKPEEKKSQKQLYYDREITINDLVFLVGPRINAAGRIEHATDSVRLLNSDKLDFADKLGAQIDELNTTRRGLDSTITSEALQMIETDDDHKNRKTTIVYNEQWHKGVIGIVASRLIENYYRPTLVLTKSNGMVTGSARSIKNFDIYDAIDSCNHLLEHFGGHTYAAGLALKPEKLDEFKFEFEKYANEHLTDNMLIPEIEIDEELYVSDINYQLYKILEQFAPFGPGNMSPLFMTNNVIDTGYARVVGRNGNNHLKFEVVHPDRTGNPLKAIAFNLGSHYSEMKTGKSFSICYHIDENTWLGQTSLQLRVKDIKFD